jgi:hypothetical protein
MEKIPTSQLLTPSRYFINPTTHNTASFLLLLKLQDLLAHFGSFLFFPLHRLPNFLLLVGILLLTYYTLLSMSTKLIAIFTFVLLILHPNFATYNMSNLEELYFIFCFSLLAFILTKISTQGFQRNFLIFLALSFILFPPWYRFFLFLPISYLLFTSQTLKSKGLRKSITFLTGMVFLLALFQPALKEIFTSISEIFKINPWPQLEQISSSFFLTLWSGPHKTWDQLFIRFVWSLSAMGIGLLIFRKIKERKLISNGFLKNNLTTMYIIGGGWLFLRIFLYLRPLSLPHYIYPLLTFSQLLLFWALIATLFMTISNLNFEKIENDVYFSKKFYIILFFITLIIISPIIKAPKFSTIPISTILAAYGLKEILR